MSQIVFETEATPDGLLIVRPKGDAASFLAADVEQGLATVCEQIDSMSKPAVVIDLSSSRYFGNAMMGAFDEIAARAKQGGGETVVCNASEEMSRMLHTLHLVPKVMEFQSLEVACTALRRRKST